MKDVEQGQFKYSTTKRQTEKDQSFYSGHLKLDYSHKEIKNQKQGSVVVIKPNYIPCIFEESLSADTSKVSALNACHEVKNE